MTLPIVPVDELISQANAELRRKNPSIDPTIFGSFAVPMTSSAALLGFSVMQTVVDLNVQLFPQTAEGEFLEDWASYENLERLPAANAQGFISIEGVLGTVIPVLSTFQGSNGLEYRSQAVSTVLDVSQVISSLTRIGSTVTATMTDDHQLASGINVTIMGADQAEYNGTFSITVITRNQFTYEITTTPASPATGVINYTGTFASVSIKSVEAGSQTNAENGTVFSKPTNIDDLADSGFAQIDGLSGGTEIETDESLRARVILSRSIVEGVFTPDQIKLAALGVPGNTRAFVVTPELSVAQTSIPVVQGVVSVTRVNATVTVTTSGTHQIGQGQLMQITGADQTEYNVLAQANIINATQFSYTIETTPTTPATGTISVLYTVGSSGFAGMVPAPGQVAVYVLRDNDPNIIPTQTILDQTKQAIIENGKLPGNTAESDVFVLAPDIVEVNFDFASTTPDTPTMDNAITLQLAAFFEDTVQFEKNVTEPSYLGAIQNTQDLETGDVLESFSLNSPTGDIIIDNGQIAVLGTVTFS